jgi:hypothetical protein
VTARPQRDGGWRSQTTTTTQRTRYHAPVRSAINDSSARSYGWRLFGHWVWIRRSRSRAWARSVVAAVRVASTGEEECGGKTRSCGEADDCVGARVEADWAFVRQP